MPSPNYPVCLIVSLQYLSRLSLHCLAGLPSSFLVITWSPSGDTRGPLVVFEVHLIFLTLLIISMTFVFSLTQTLVFLSLLCDVEHTSFHFGLRGRKCVLCLFGQCSGLCTICHSWQHTEVVHLFLQADGKVAFEDNIAVLYKHNCLLNMCNVVQRQLFAFRLEILERCIERLTTTHYDSQLLTRTHYDSLVMRKKKSCHSMRKTILLNDSTSYSTTHLQYNNTTILTWNSATLTNN